MSLSMQPQVSFSQMNLNSLLVCVILVTKTDLTVLQINESLVGDGHPVGVASQILEDLLGSAERRAAILPIISVIRSSFTTPTIP
jgi:hypothetical protein